MQVSPADTYELLTTKWGVRHHLATALIERCGGHLFDICSALASLQMSKEDAVSVRDELFSDVRKCLRSVEGSPGDYKATVRILKELARTGFYAVEDETAPIIAKISLYNVGGLVAKRSTICGFDYKSRREAWTSQYGLVPAQQSMRLAIAEELDRRDELDPK